VRHTLALDPGKPPCSLNRWFYKEEDIFSLYITGRMYIEPVISRGYTKKS
jgi:hypothetical protein